MEKKATPTLGARFYRTDAGGEPVREWLKALPAAEWSMSTILTARRQLSWPVEAGNELVGLFS
jgi:hypothetical protein